MEIIASPEIFITKAAEWTRHIRLGTGMISVGCHNPLWVTERLVLRDHLPRGRVLFGAVADRAKWRPAGLVHCAETREEAYRDVAYGLEHWFGYFQSVVGLPYMSVKGDSVHEMVDYVAQSGLGASGTPDDVRAQIHRLVAQPNGGFGADLMLAHEWANTQATRRSAESIAKYVMPQYQGRASATPTPVPSRRTRGAPAPGERSGDRTARGGTGGKNARLSARLRRCAGRRAASAGSRGRAG
jgi:alkanesulfonate monooxygenase SsuD/methylene tetrahydromethanopterin reductase-like flavin-dependent oxidoreductase (luciferase family)